MKRAYKPDLKTHTLSLALLKSVENTTYEKLVKGDTEQLKKALPPYVLKEAKKRPKVKADVNFLLAVGIVAKTTDEMILDGSAIEGWRNALWLAGWGKRKAAKYQRNALDDFIKDWIRLRMTAFESRHPDFRIVQFIGDVFKERVFDGDDCIPRSQS